MLTKGSFSSSSAYMRLNHRAETYGRSRSSSGKVRKGYVPVLVGRDGAMMEKLWLPTKLIGHPQVVALLNSSADEFGYSQQGLLKIDYDIVPFKRMIEIISNHN
ncbi:hypothetical protein FEM48_Zijuj04G0206200 [Ziziphus jujuba var. spinosa]|uniref:Auxin-responsive protein SAUR71-like n=1 Tax=Ziziphus jujuba var. spinosa TaxID=714518 RepID=A0A978VM07_ZIZJJ|nr:hypothetical protein FEM48_Zijuj04G0160100 [Ziziphus jujuba var. spinosa]KAH7534126.1 hypothetical protein FEM48_Zijuj04G0206200 [Ziziphus jujuba var. spinosa]